MLLTISAEMPGATDLGYLLHKNPDRIHRIELPFGIATVFYPEASRARCTAALHLKVDPIGLVRGRKGPEATFALEEYVNDRPYAATSLLSVAIARVYGTALAGKCTQRPDLPERRLPLRAELPAVPSRGGPAILGRLFEPLGYRVQSVRYPLDETFGDWGDGPYHGVTLESEVRLRDLLSHLYVLVPVLDDDKHYWVGESEVEKLLRHGDRWLSSHPERTLIAQRYLKHRRSLVDAALARLLDEDPENLENVRESGNRQEEAIERPLGLNDERMQAVVTTLVKADARRILDLGCGDGKLLQRLLQEKNFDEIAGLDVSHRALEMAERRLRLDRLPDFQRRRIHLLHGSLTYRDRRLEGFDAATVVEVIEHLDPARLRSFERVLFECARPGTVVVTTPNREFNTRFENLSAGGFRHRDHRFEWTRQEFRDWADDVAGRFDYSVGFTAIGPEDARLGPPTQMAVFRQ